MCTLYQLERPDAAARLFGAAWPDGAEFAKNIYPDRIAPVIRETGEGRAVVGARWGVPPPPNGDRPVVNIRNLASPFWRGINKAANRCLVPATAFSEWTAEPDPATGRKRKHWFALADGEPFALAGMTRRDADAAGDLPAGLADLGLPAEPAPPRFAFLTTAPNALVAAVHPRAMPVVLTGDAADAWLAGVPAEALADAFPAERMRMLD